MPRRLTIDPLSPDPAVVRAAAEALRAGHIIVYPTETLYGIGADPGNPAALEKLRAAKQRHDSKPVLLIARDLDAALPYIADVPMAALGLLDAFWPGPLTIVFRAQASVPQELTVGRGTIGVRVPSLPFCLALTERFGGPITSTSANITGLPTPQRIEEIEAMLGDSIDLYIDGGALPSTLPSTVVDVTTSPPTIVRDGAVTREFLHVILPGLR